MTDVESKAVTIAAAKRRCILDMLFLLQRRGTRYGHAANFVSIEGGFRKKEWPTRRFIPALRAASQAISVKGKGWCGLTS
jgi:hypothetical protein